MNDGRVLCESELERLWEDVQIGRADDGSAIRVCDAYATIQRLQSCIDATEKVVKVAKRLSRIENFAESLIPHDGRAIALLDALETLATLNNEGGDRR